MKLTVQEIVIANSALKSVTNKELPAFLSYQLGKLEIKLSGRAGLFDKVRNDLIKKYGYEREDKRIEVLKEKEAEFYEELNKVVAVEEEIDFTPLPFSAFEAHSFPKEFFIALDKFIVQSDIGGGGLGPPPK